MVQAGLSKIGWIGTGVMGNPMAKHIMNKGHNMMVYNRTASKAENLVQAGARFMQPSEIAQEADYLFMMLGYPHDVEKMVLDSEVGILKHMKPGATLIDCTSSSPSLAEQIAVKCEEHSVMSVDAPVSGGDIGAKAGKLVTMAGGSKDALASVKELLDIYSTEVAHMGGAGAGQHTKLANQMQIALIMTGVCEALLYAEKANLDHDKMIELLSKGGARSMWLENCGPKMIRRDFEPGFYVEHFVKDLGMVLDECRRMNLSVPGTALCYQLYQTLMAQGKGRDGIHVLLTSLEEMNNMKVRTYQ